MKNLFLFLLLHCFLPGILWCQSGKVGINTTSPQAMLHVKDGNVLHEGAYQSNNDPGPTPVNGTGVRMMWYPDKAAFRAGRAVDNSWDENNIGHYSFAAGYGVVASGQAAMALGHNSTASGMYSFAAGNNARATDFQSVALGLNALASGNSTFAAGYDAKADGHFSLAVGRGATAYAHSSLAIGFNAVASGNFSTAVGNFVQADANHSSAFGYTSLAKGSYSSAIGFGTQANSSGSIVLGMFNDTIVSTLQDLGDEAPLLILGNGENPAARSNALVVNFSGDTGIGTNHPAHRLDVKVNASNAQVSRFTSSGGYAEMLVSNSTNEVDFGVVQNYGYVGTKVAHDFVIRTSATPRLCVDGPTGYIGIGTQNPTHTIEVNGTAGKPGGGSWSATSDARLKQNITPYTDGLTSLLQIRPVTYQYNALSGYDTSKQHIGIIAQELQQVAPYMVSTSTKEVIDGSTNYLEVDNSAMMYMLINAVKEQQTMIAQLQAEINQLKAVKN